jgi:hypothetical protein
MKSLCPCPPGSGLWEGLTPRSGSRALGHGYKGGGDIRDVHCVNFPTKAGRKLGDYFVVSEPSGAEYYVVSFDVKAPPGSFKKEYSKVREKALWLLCAKPEYYQSTYVCRSRVSAELLYNIIEDVFGDSLKRIALCPVKPSTNEYKVKIEELLENVKSTLMRRVEESIERCRKWTEKTRSRFRERIKKLRAVDANLANTIELKLSECYENTNHGGSPRGSTMTRLPGTYRDVRGQHGEPV